MPKATRSEVRLIANPTQEQLHVYWDARSRDPLVPQFYADTSPQNFADFCLAVEQDYIFRLAVREGNIIGALWLHHLVHTTDGVITDAWLGAYVLPDARGRHLVRSMWDDFHPERRALGVDHIHGATRSDNEMACRIGMTQVGMHPVGIYPCFTTFAGVPHDCILMTLHPSDTPRAWAMAFHRVHCIPITM